MRIKKKEGNSARRSATILVIPEHKGDVWFRGVYFGRTTVDAAKKVQNDEPGPGEGTFAQPVCSGTLSTQLIGWGASPEETEGSKMLRFVLQLFKLFQKLGKTQTTTVWYGFGELCVLT